MKTKIILALLGVCLATTTNSPACIYCMMLAQQGLSPDDPNGRAYDSPPAQWISITNEVATNAVAVVSNAPVALPKANPPVAMNFTNGALVGFDVLAGYEINITPDLDMNTNGAAADAKVNAMIPANIRALDCREVAVDGFMIPSQMENGKVTEFLLSRNPPACCYGGVPMIHEWIKVRVKTPGVDYEEYNIVRAHGVLRVGPERVDGSLASIYRMEADKVETTPQH